MWIQHWSPRNPDQWAIWKDGDESYWAFTRRRALRLPYISWRVGRSVYAAEIPKKGRALVYVIECAPGKPPPAHEICGTDEEINTLWEQIMHDPTSFMIRQAL